MKTTWNTFPIASLIFLCLGMSLTHSATIQQCGGSPQVCGLQMDLTNDIIELFETKIQVWDGTGTILYAELRLEDTNPTFFSLTYNALKDGMMSAKSTFSWLKLWYATNYSGINGQYNKIVIVGNK